LLETEIRTRHQEFKPLVFQVDSGTNVTSIPIVTAQQVGLLIPQKIVELDVQTAVGKVRQRIHPGYIAVRISGLEGRTYIWPCHFVEHEGNPPQALLGLSGVIDDLDIGFTGDYALEARYGWLVLKERLGQVRSS
jgi:hypothetical protein